MQSWFVNYIIYSASLECSVISMNEYKITQFLKILGWVVYQYFATKSWWKYLLRTLNIVRWWFNYELSRIYWEKEIFCIECHLDLFILMCNIRHELCLWHECLIYLSLFNEGGIWKGKIVCVKMCCGASENLWLESVMLEGWSRECLWVVIVLKCEDVYWTKVVYFL